MTEPRPRRSPLRPPTALAIVVAATTAFAGVSIVLAFQMAEGRDPALRRTQVSAPATAVARRQIVVRKIERRVIVDIVRDRPATVRSPRRRAAVRRSSPPRRTPLPPPHPHPPRS